MTPEGKLKKRVCSELKKLGCTVLQYKQDSTTVKGFPDTIVLLPEGLTIFIEFKKSKTAKFPTETTLLISSILKMRRKLWRR